MALGVAVGVIKSAVGGDSLPSASFDGLVAAVAAGIALELVVELRRRRAPRSRSLGT